MLHNCGNNRKTLFARESIMNCIWKHDFSLSRIIKKITLSTIHHKSVQILTGEMLKTYNRMTAQIPNDMFKLRIIPYNMCNQNNFEINGTET